MHVKIQTLIEFEEKKSDTFLNFISYCFSLPLDSGMVSFGLTHAFFDWIIWCVMKEQTFFVRVFVVLFFIIIELIRIFGRREGETEKKNCERTKRNVITVRVIDCDTKNTQCFGGGRRKKKKNNNNQKRRKSVARVQRRKNREISAWENSARRTRDARN